MLLFKMTSFKSPFLSSELFSSESGSGLEDWKKDWKIAAKDSGSGFSACVYVCVFVCVCILTLNKIRRKIQEVVFPCV